MLHAICDFCGRDCDRNAILIVMKPFQNFARYHTDMEPYGHENKPKSFVMCSDCRKKHDLPNPYESYSEITSQAVKYDKCLDNYTELKGEDQNGDK
jgi:hypothetical protein